MPPPGGMSTVPEATGGPVADASVPEVDPLAAAFAEALAGETFAALFDAQHFRAGLAEKGVEADGLDDAALHALLVERGDELRVSPSPFFDERHYLDRHPDIREGGMWGFLHFLVAGIDEGRQPHPLVDVEFIAADQGVPMDEALRTWLARASAPNAAVWHGYRRWSYAPTLAQQRAIWRGLARRCPEDGLAMRVLCYLPLLVDPQLAGDVGAWSIVADALDAKAYDTLPSPFLRAPLARRAGDEATPLPLLERLPADAGRRWSPTPWLDMAFYDARNPDLAQVEGPLLLHFLRHGQFEGRVGHPMFNHAWYAAHYGIEPDRSIHVHYVVSAWRGYAMRSNATCMAPIDYAVMAGVDIDRAIDDIVANYADLFAISSPSAARAVSGGSACAVARQIAAAAALDPAIRPDVPTRELLPKPLDIGHAAPLQRMSRMLKGCEVVLLRDHVTIGGADRVAGLMARALAAAGYTVGVVASARTPDHDRGAARYGDASIVVIEDLLGYNDEVLAHELVYEAATLPDTRATIAVNSAAALDVFTRFGRQVSAWAPMFVTYFCDDLDAHGNPDGYPARTFLSLVGRASGVFTDTTHLRDVLRARVAPSVELAARVRALPTPYEPDGPPATTPPATDDRGRREGDGPRIAWAGRFDRQKRADLLPPLRALMPEATFDVWGKAVLDRSPFAGTTDHGLTLHGTYGSFAEVAASAPDAFLYTALWDGAPTILLDAVAGRIPIVASDVGGVRECLPPDYPYLVPPGAGPDDYAAALRRLLADTRGNGREAVVRGFEEVIASRTPAAFANALVGALRRAGVPPRARVPGGEASS